MGLPLPSHGGRDERVLDNVVTQSIALISLAHRHLPFSLSQLEKGGDDVA